MLKNLCERCHSDPSADGEESRSEHLQANAQLLDPYGRGVDPSPEGGFGPAFRPAALSPRAAGRSVRAGRPQGEGPAAEPPSTPRHRCKPHPLAFIP
jgi:hypothetical protein